MAMDDIDHFFTEVCPLPRLSILLSLLEALVSIWIFQWINMVVLY